MDFENGETSKKKNSDTSENNKPLKKARYVWQVKGKHHLKENLNIENKSNIETINNNVNQCKSNALCSDKSCIEALIANSDKILDIKMPDSPKNSEKSDETPISLVKTNPKNEDYYLRKWQARQIAKGFVDNTINRVLESWMVAPFDASDFVENMDNDCKIEDEGILMAIQSHGLQSSFHNNKVNSSMACTCPKTKHSRATSQSYVPFHQRMQDDFSVEYYENLCVLKDNFKSDFDRNCVENEDTKCSDSEKEINNSNDSFENLKMNDTDFLDAAVMVAIQKKGLIITDM